MVIGNSHISLIIGTKVLVLRYIEEAIVSKISNIVRIIIILLAHIVFSILTIIITTFATFIFTTVIYRSTSFIIISRAAVSFLIILLGIERLLILVIVLY